MWLLARLRSCAYNLPRDRSPSRSLHEMRNEIVVRGIRSPSLKLNVFDNLAVDSLLDCVRLIVLNGMATAFGILVAKTPDDFWL